MGFPEARDTELRKQAEAALNFADDLADWVLDHGPLRRSSEVGTVSEEQELKLFQLRRLALNLAGSAKVPAAAAVYGASQTGKSLFVGRVVEPKDAHYSSLGSSENSQGYIAELDFNHDVNPQSGSNEATALVTRFSTWNRLKTNPPPSEFPVTVRALTRAEWIKVMGRGCISECELPTEIAWDDSQLEQILDGLSREYGEESADRYWRLDMVDAYADLKQNSPHLYRAAESEFNSLLARYPLNEDGYIELASRIFWFGDRFSGLTPWFRKVNQFIARLDKESKGNSIAVHWAATRFLLDSQHTNVQSSKHSRWNKEVSLTDISLRSENGWLVLDHKAGDGKPVTLQELKVMQSALLEMTIPVIANRLNDDWSKVIEEIDILDLPGARSDGGNLTEVDTDDKILSVVKRGKVDYLFDRYMDERQVQTLLLLFRGGNQEVRGKIKRRVDRWGATRYGESRWPRKVPVGETPALFVGMTGIDAEIVDRTVTSDLYETRLKNLRGEVLLEIMTEFGSKLGSFDNVYPMRYPGTWDKNHEKRQQAGAEQWDTAGKAFLESKLVHKHVADAQRRWQCAMTDNDGGMSLLSAGFCEVTSNVQKQDNLKEQLQQLRAGLLQLGQRWVVDPNSNQTREARAILAQRVLTWLIENDAQVQDRVTALQTALCFEEGHVSQLAEPMVNRASRTGQRAEPVQRRVERLLPELLDQWCTTIAPQRWQQHLDHASLRNSTNGRADGTPASIGRAVGNLLDAETFGQLTVALHDYLRSENVYDHLLGTILSIVKLRGDDAMHRHARREYIRLVLNDHVTNPGPDTRPLGEPLVEFGSDSLMSPFIHRWSARLSTALATGVGDHVEIPSGNAELQELLAEYQ